MMEKKLKDYLHFYLGCKCAVYFGDVYLANDTIRHELFLYPWFKLKPILRPLSDMTKEESIDVFKMVSMFDLSECVFEFVENYRTWINAELNGRVIDAIKFVGDNVEMMNNDGSFSSLNPVSEVFRYYLSKHFDIFDLIEDKLAIDKTTLNQPPPATVTG